MKSLRSRGSKRYTLLRLKLICECLPFHSIDNFTEKSTRHQTHLWLMVCSEYDNLRVSI